LAPTVTPAPTPTPKPRPTPSIWGSYEKGQITSPALANNLVGDPATCDYYVFLPPGYDTTTERFPVVYVLHGFPLHAGYYFQEIKSAQESLRRIGEARDTIFVFPDAFNAFGGSFYLSSPTIGDYETYTTKELVHQIDATYRTIPSREGRGITGCSMGGFGALPLGFKYPEVFSVVAANSGGYDWEHDPGWEDARASYTHEPSTWSQLGQLGLQAQVYFAVAAAVAPNPDKPPFFLDMPFTLVDGEAQIVEEVRQKVIAIDPANDVRRYLDQPVRLRGLLIYHGEYDYVESARTFLTLLTDLGVEHEYVEVKSGSHCGLDWTPVLMFMSEHLAR